MNITWQPLVDRPMTGLTGDTLVKSIKHGKLLAMPYDRGMVFAGSRGQPIENQLHRTDMNNFVKTWSILELERFVERGEKICTKLLAYRFDEHLSINMMITNYITALSELAPYMYAIFSMEQSLEERLISLLPNGIDLGDILSNPELPSDNSLFDRGIMRIAISGCKPTHIKKIVQEYGYLQLTNHLSSMPLQQEDIAKICSQFSDPKQELSLLEKKDVGLCAQYRKKTAILGMEATQYLKLMHRYQHFRNQRIKTFKLLQFRLLRPIVESAVTKNTNFQDLIWYTIDELMELSETHTVVDISARKKIYCILGVGNKINYSHGSPLTPATNMPKQLTGRCAQPGNVSGKVRIILESKDVGALQTSEILVTTMTTPDLVPAMRRAAAIVTDEGGVLCHAAIVSRELGIPCVIGTINATKILKNGQIISVNATEGIIKILSQAK